MISTVIHTWVLCICVILVELDPYSFILSIVLYKSPKNFFIFVIKVCLHGIVHHVGWYGIVSGIAIIVLQLHFGFIYIRKSLNLVKELSRHQIPVNAKQKEIQSRNLKELKTVREVLKLFTYFRLVRLG